MSAITRKKIISQASSNSGGGGGGGTDPADKIRITNLENNEFKILYFEGISSSTGTVTIPTNSTIILGDFPQGLDAVCETIVNGEPTGLSAVDSSNNTITVSSFDTSGNYVLSGTPTSYPVAILFVLKTKAIDLHNLTFDNIIESQSIVDRLSSMVDVGITSPVLNEMLVYDDTTGKWLNKSVIDITNLQYDDLRTIKQDVLVNGANFSTINEQSLLSGDPVYLSDLYLEVKLAESINKGQAVYISSANGTNIIVSKASNTTEATSSKTLGLLNFTGATNAIGNVITEGLIVGIDTSAATVGDPIWLGTSGNLIFGLASKPVAPAHLVYIGIVSRVHATNGEILVKVQNGFELMSNKQNSLVIDGTGIKYPTVDAVNANVWTKQVIQITSSTAPTVNTTDFRRTFVDITALAGNINLSTNLTGTPQNGDVLIYQIKDNGTARTIATGSNIEAKGEFVPNTTVISKRLNIGFTWDSTTSKWGCLSVSQEI